MNHTRPRSTPFSQTRPATWKQKARLEALGVEFSGNITVAEASALITDNMHDPDMDEDRAFGDIDA